MALQEKLNNLAASAGSKVNSAIESGKLHIKINNEERKITEIILNLGELTLDKLDAGETYDDEIMALYSSIQAAREVIADAKTTIDAYRQDFTSAPPVCTNCGAELRDGAKFCAYCGTQVAAPALANVCPSCGETVEDTDLFCIACGTKVGENAAE